MMWSPNSVRTTSEIVPGLRRNATSSNSFTITPRRNQPSAPPCSRETLSAEYFFATSAKPEPPPCRSFTTRDSANCSALALAAESGFGTITIWRNEIAAGRLGCCARFVSQNARISASDGGIGRSLPFCFSPSISRCCRMARRCWSASQRRHSSSDTNPAERSCVWNSGIEVNCLRTFWTVCSTASCTSWSVTLMVVSRSACCTSSSSSTIWDRIWRRAASRPAESSGTFAPCDCASTSCSSTCEARIGLVPTTATTRSTARAVAERPCAATAAAPRAAHVMTMTVTPADRMSARRPLGRAVACNGRRAGGALETRAGRLPGGGIGGANRLRPLHRARDAGVVERPRLAAAERRGQEGRHRQELRAPLGDRRIQVALHVRHRQPHTRVGRRRGVLEQLRREVQQPLEPADAGIVLSAHVTPVVCREDHAGGIDLLEQHVALGQQSHELRELVVRGRRNAADVIGIERQQPARQVSHAERAPPERGQRVLVVTGGHDLRHGLADPCRGAGLDLELTRLGETVEIQRIETVRARALQIDPERIPHFRERRPADDVKSER